MIFATILILDYSSAQVTSNISCKCVIFRFDNIQDHSLKAEQMSVLELFLSKNQSLTLGINTNKVGKDMEIIDKIKEGYQKGLFDLAVQGGANDDDSKLSREDKMIFLYKSNQKLYDIFNMRTSFFIPVDGIFNLSTLEAMNQVGMRIISGKENYEVSSDKILPTVSNKTTRANFTQIYNIPQTMYLSKQPDKSWMKQSIEQIMNDISASIKKYGYAVIALYPQDFVKLSNDKLSQPKNYASLQKLGDLIDQISSQGTTIGSFASVTGISKSQYYEMRIPEPVINDSNLTVEVVYDGLNFPTKMAFLGKDDILVLEKNDGKVKRIVNGTLKNEIIDLDVGTKGERGLLGIAVAHRGEESPYVYLYYTSADSDGSDISVIENETNVENLLFRYEFSHDNLINPKLLLRLPEKSTWAHNGGAMTIGPDNNLYLVIGDQVISDTKAQNVYNGTNPKGNGGILRFSLEGDPIGKGILGSQFPLNLYYAYGIRNSFGIAFDPITNNLWDTENGAQAEDEINLVKPGFNSGWKKIHGTLSKNNTDIKSSSINLSQEFEDFNGSGIYREPELVWTFPSGPTGISFATKGELGTKYNSTVFVGDFHNGYLYNFNLSSDGEHLELNSKSAKNLKRIDLDPFLLGKGFGGIVDVKEGPDGYLYVLSTHAGDANCLTLANHCVPYESPVGGTIFRVRPLEIPNIS